MKQLLLALLLLAGMQRATAQACNLELGAQSQVNAVPATGCTTVTNLVIRGGSASNTAPDQIVDLTPLAGITEVTGTVSLILNDLTDLTALGNIRTIGGSLIIQSATSAVNLGINSFQSLQSIGGDLIILGNSGITVIAGFPLLRTTKSLTIANNSALGDIRSFGSLQSTGTYQIYQCAALRSISGFVNLTSIIPRSGQPTATFNISDNPLLQTISDFPSLTTVEYFTIYNNPALQQVTGFNSLKNLQGFTIDANGITSIAGFNGGLGLSGNGVARISGNGRLRSIDGFTGASMRSFSVYNNAALLTISGFNNGTFETVDVASNAALISTAGFNNSSFTRSIQFSSNSQLDSITGFTGARAPATITLSDNPRLQGFARAFAFSDYTTLTTLNIVGNTRLSACGQPWICSYLHRGGYAMIGNNAPACTQATILQTCQPLATQAPAELEAVYPNPVHDVLYLRTPSRYTVRDLLGRVLLQGEGKQVSTTTQPSGVYLVETGWEAKQSMRIVKQ